MSIYDKSSLVLIPSGTKTGKVYSQKPVSGDGDFTFTRSSAATRVNASGNIEKETQNLLLQSNTFSNAAWSKFSNTTYIVTTETITDPFGVSNSVYKVTLTGSGYFFLRQTLNGETRYITASSYIKKSSSDLNVAVDQSDGGTANAASNTDWQRLSATHASGYGFSFIDIVLTGVSGDYYYVSSAQMELGGAARDYIETTTTAVEGGITDNVPRLDYTDSSCPALLLEPQRTNICPNSEDVSNWNLAFATATANDTISPEGVQNAAKIVTSSTGCDVKLTSIPVSASTTYTATFYCKLTSGSGLQTRFYDNTNGANIEFYDYSSQLVVGEWKRVTRTFTTPAGCNNIQIWFLAASSSASVTAHYWGYQLEAGSYATSYIPTYGSSVTRTDDECENTSATNVIGQTEGTAFIEFDPKNGTGERRFFLQLGSGSTTIYARIESGGGLTSQILNGGTDYLTSTGTTISSGTNKFAVAYANNDAVFYLNGVQLATSSSVVVPALSDLYVGCNSSGAQQIGGDVSQTLLFKTRLTNAELAALTTI